MARAEKVTAPTVAASRCEAGGRDWKGPAERAAARVRWRASATSGRQVDLLVGPAGAGKTTTMRALRAAWIVEHGRGSVVGLAPSAAAAQALADDLGVACENTAKWLHEYDHGRTELRARPAGDRRRGHARRTPRHSIGSPGSPQARAPRCCSSATPINSSPSTPAAPSRSSSTGARMHPELIEIHRFTNEWEKDASLALSRGDVQVISTYGRHKRIREGVTDEMVDAAYVAWRADCAAGTRQHPRDRVGPRRPRAQRTRTGRAAAAGRRRRPARGRPGRRLPSLGRGHRHHAPERPPHPDDARRVGQERRPLAGHRHPARRLRRGQAPRRAAEGETVLPRGVRRASTSTSGTPSPRIVPRASPSTRRTSS